jgi:hypothetical protein
MTAGLGLAFWCGSGALVGASIGIVKHRPGIGMLLGTFCGIFGWIMLLGARPRQIAPGEPSIRRQPQDLRQGSAQSPVTRDVARAGRGLRRDRTLAA